MTLATGHPYTPSSATAVEYADAPTVTISDELPTYTVHLRAENKSRATVSLWTGAARQLHAYLQASGMPTDVRAIRREHLEAWLASLHAAGAKPSTVNNRYRSVQPLFRWLTEEGLISDNPMRNMRPPAIPDDEHVAVPTAEDVTRLLQHTAKDKGYEGIRDLAMLHLLATSGLRRAELAGMTTDSLNTDAGTVTVVGKGRKVRVTKVHDRALQAMLRYERARRMHPARASESYWLGKRGPVTGWGVYQMVDRRAAAAGVPHLTVHQLRHFWAHNMKAAGIADGDLRFLAGWSRGSRMVDRYAASTAAERALAAAERINAGGRS
jgi:site-specific recombinase XerD